jgi:hypothetical protein
MTVNTTFTSGAILTAAQMNNLPFGSAGTVTSTSTQNVGGGSYQDITSLTTSVTLVTGRLYLAIATINVGTPGTGTAGLNFKCLFGATDVGTQGFNMRSDDSQVASFQGIYYFQATGSGATTIKMQGQAYSQAVNLSVAFSNHRLTIIDLGNA